MTSTPLVSIILPIYNAAPYLKECLDSIFSQTYTFFEIIAINDGSEDHPETIIELYKDSRLHYFENEANIGVAKTLNKAIALAKGDYLLRMDADDIQRPEKIKKQVDFMLNHPETSILGTSFSQFKYDRPLFNNLPTGDSQIKLELFFKSALCHPTVMMDRRMFKIHGYRCNENQRTAEDYNLWIDASIGGLKFANLPEKLLVYRQHSNQNTFRYFDDLMELDDSLRLKLANFFFKKIIEKYGRHLYLNFIYNLFENLNELKAIKKMVLEIRKSSIPSISHQEVSQFWKIKWENYFLNYCYNYNNSGAADSFRLARFYMADASFYSLKGVKKKLLFILVCLRLKKGPSR